MEEKQIHDDLASIRSLMERSSKFISLSGLSGILAGIYALFGAAYAYYILYADARKHLYISRADLSSDGELWADMIKLVVIAAAVLILSVVTGYILTARKAKRKGQPVWGNTSRSLLFNMAAPLVTGGVLMFIFMCRGYFGIVAPASLIFYGLALIGASNFTFTDVKYLGLTEIVLGLVAALYPGYGLLFWTIGFGVLHIVYGSIMYIKYDK